MVDRLQPAAVRAGVKKHIPWKMFGTSIATQLTSNVENMKTAQQTLGPANTQVTADVYTLSIAHEVRSAHDTLVDMVIAAKVPATGNFALIGPRWSQILESQAVSF